MITQNKTIKKIQLKVKKATNQSLPFYLYKKDFRYKNGTACLIFNLNQLQKNQIQLTENHHLATVFSNHKDPMFQLFIKKNKGLKKFKKKYIV